MSIRMILLPIFVQVALTFVLLFWSNKPGARAENGPAWREELDLPVLLYVLTIFAYLTKFADLLFLALAWVFVVLRVLRAVRNECANTGPLFIASAIVLGVMWLIYAVRLLLAI
jgi:hypothetical protein